MSESKPVLPKAPSDLSVRARKLWGAVVLEYELAAAELEVLRNALVALDRADQAGRVVDAEGVVCVDRYGSPKTHPACDVESRNRALFARLVGQLGVRLTVEPVRRGYAKPGPKPRSAKLRSVS